MRRQLGFFFLLGPLTHLCRVDSFTTTPCSIEISIFNANSVDPDQTPRSVFFFFFFFFFFFL